MIRLPRPRWSRRCGSTNSRHVYRMPCDPGLAYFVSASCAPGSTSSAASSSWISARQRADDRVDQLRVVEPVVLVRVRDVVDAGDRREREHLLRRAPDQRVARVADQRHRLAERDPERLGRLARDRRLVDGHVVDLLGPDAVAGGDGGGRRPPGHVADVVGDALLDPEPDERRVGRLLLDAEAAALDLDVAVLDQRAHLRGERGEQLVARPAHLCQRVARRAEPVDPVLHQHDVAGLDRRGGDLAADGRVGETGEHAWRQRRDERGDEHEHGEADGGADVVADPAERETHPAHGYSSLARRTALVRADGSWRMARTTVASTRIGGQRDRRDGGLGRDDDDRRGHGRHAGVGERRERQHEPREQEAEQRAEDEARHQEHEVLDREPQQQLARAEPQRLEQRELADPLRDRHRHAHEEADRREHEGRQRPEPEDADDPEPERVAREVGRHRRPVHDRRRARSAPPAGPRRPTPPSPGRPTATTRRGRRPSRPPRRARGRARGRRRARTASSGRAAGTRRPSR